MYSGPGSRPMLAAAAAWQGLAAELYTSAASYDSLIADLLDGPWQGLSAASMAAAAAPQVAWLSGTGAQAEQTAIQAVAAANAYEGAYAATVPPSEVAANRSLLAALLATNFLGQNTAAIAAAEAQYAEMWVQDAAAMYGYAAASATAAQLTPFNPTATAVNPAGLTGQDAAVAQAVSGAVDAQALSQIPKALSGLAGIANEPPWLTDLAGAIGLSGHAWNENGDGIIVSGMVGDVMSAITGSETLDAGSGIDTFMKMIGPTRLFATTFQTIQGIEHNFEGIAKSAVSSAAAAAEGATRAAASALPGAGPSGISGVLGKAASVGGFSVPSSWAGTAPAVTPVSVALDGFGTATAADPAIHGVGGLPLIGGGGGRGLSTYFATPRYGFKPTVMTAPPAGG